MINGKIDRLEEQICLEELTMSIFEYAWRGVMSSEKQKDRNGYLVQIEV